MAVDQQTGELYVLEAGAGNLKRHQADGTPAPFVALGTNTIGGLAFSAALSPRESEVAIDESGTATDGNIYVTQPATGRIEIFNSAGEHIGALSGSQEGPFDSDAILTPCGVAVDPAGHVFVTTGGENGKIYEYAPAANPPVNADSAGAVPSAVGSPCAIALGAGSSAGTLFATFSEEVSTAEGPKRRRGAVALDPETGAVEFELMSGTTGSFFTDSLAVDPGSGHVYTGSGGSGTPRILTEWSVTSGGAAKVSEFAASEVGNRGEGIAVEGASGRLYLSGGQEESMLSVNVISPLVTIPDVLTGEATITGDTEATLRGTVNPDGVALDECLFEYGTTTAYGETAPCVPAAAEAGSGKSPVEVRAEIGGLVPETLYHFRLVARNVEVQAQVKGQDRTLKTPSKPTIAEQWAARVGSGEAILRARINPENAATEYRLEWGTATGYGSQTPTRPVGDDASLHTLSERLDGLRPGTTYHYRFVATNHLGEVKGPDRAFSTFRAAAAAPPCPNDAVRTGASGRLPDCRGYELVSHAERDGGDILPMININSQPAALEQSAADGGALSYTSYRSAGAAEAGPYAAQYIARRGAAGWSGEVINPPRGTPLNPIPFLDAEFRAFSADLCQGWLLLAPNTALLSAGAIEGYANLYRRSGCGAVGYEALTAPDPPGLAPQTGNGGFDPDLQGVAADGSLAVFRVDDKLTEDAAAGPYQLYAHGGEVLRPLCVQPNGAPYLGPCSVGTANDAQIGIRTASVWNAVAADGSGVYWTKSPEVSPAGPGQIYLRVNPASAQSKVSAGKCSEAAKACTLRVSETVTADSARFWGASAGGSRALFEVEQASSPLDDNLYEFDRASGTSSLLAGEVMGVMGASEDLARVYLVSEEALAAGAAAGQPNLYLHERGAGFEFVATLAAKDAAQRTLRSFSPVNVQPDRHSAQVSPSGRHLTFVSTASPTGYDNTDQASGEAAAEVYLYDAAADRLLCASCNPSGARPRGQRIVLEGQPSELQAAAYIPAAENQLYAPRVLSDDGQRLFFMSFDALTPADVNEAQDLYEWEAPGAGSCSADSPAYSPANGGCVYLLSSGVEGSARFVDADRQGRDVFFATEASLLPAEDGSLVDIYDARVGGGFPPPSEPLECEGAACQSPAPPPPLLAPASSAYRGAGNMKPAGRKCPKGKRRARSKGKRGAGKRAKLRCVKAQRGKRANEHRRARRRGARR